MADKTALQESSQALFCAIADFLGIDESNRILDFKKFTSYEDFKIKNQKLISTASTFIKTPGVSLSDVEKFLNENEDWYKSSLLIGNALIKQISTIDTDFKIKQKGFQNIYYFRGDEEIMGNIQKLFTIANKSPITIKKQGAFGNVNKWCPADIYFGSNKAKDLINKQLSEAKINVYNFSDLNILINDLIDKGDLLPLSLKKTTSNVVIQKVNFDKKKELEQIKKIKIRSVSNWKPYKPVKFPEKGETRDYRIFLLEGGEIKFRHDPSSYAFKTEYVIGNEARGGSIGSIKGLCEIISYIDKSIASKLLSEYNIGERYFKEQMIPVLKNRDKLNKKNPKLFDYTRGQISAMTIINRVMPILKSLISPNNTKSDQLVRLMYQYVTSRTELSGRFVIAK